MNKKRLTDGLSQLMAILIVMAILLPFAIQLQHLATEHVHEVCFGASDHHLHSNEVKCDLDKFKINVHFFIPRNDFKEVNNNQYTAYNNGYKSLISFRLVSYGNLRAPPSLV